MNRLVASHRSTQLEAGFTLIEMLVVLTIIGLLAAVALSNLALRPAFVDRARLGTALAEAMSAARAKAAASGQPVPVDLARLSIKDIGYRPMLGHATVPVVFADGSTNGGIVSIKGHAQFTIDWMTGRIGDAPR